MKFYIFTSSVLLFTIAFSAPPPSTPYYAVSPAQRHIIRHEHKLNCLNCFCGHNAVERARHACPPDRDLVLCPPSVPIRTCYRCSCFSRIPVTPSPPIMTPHPRSHGNNEVHKQDDGKLNHDHKHGNGSMKHEDHKNGEDHKNDEDDKKNEDHRKDEDHMKDKDNRQDNNKNAINDRKTMQGPNYDDSHDEEKGEEDMLMSTPHGEEGDMKMPDAKPEKSKQVPMPSKQPVLCHKATPTPTSTPTPSPETEAEMCSTFSRRGGTGNTVFDVDLALNHGTFNVTWQMDRVPDLLEIFYEGKKIFSTIVPFKGGGTASVKYSGNSSVITVRVSSTTDGTGWFMQIGCPRSN